MANFQDAGFTSQTTFDILDVAPGKYEIRIRALNSAGISSDWVTITKEISGLLGAPSGITGANLTAVSSLAVLTWNQATDLDVRIGGRIEIRHSSAIGAASWANSVSLGKALAGTSTVAVLPLMVGTYLIRAYDSSNVPSTTVATVTTEAANAVPFTTLQDIIEDPFFSGVKIDCVNDGDYLKIRGYDDIDDWADVDLTPAWDTGNQGVDPDGTYFFDTGYDHGSVSLLRFTRHILAIEAQPYDKFDLRTVFIDSWADFDGAGAAACDCQVYIRHTDDDPAGSPTWSSWDLLTVNDYNHRAFQFKAELTSNDPAYNIRVEELRVKVQEIT